jgi:hypothetical protein
LVPCCVVKKLAPSRQLAGKCFIDGTPPRSEVFGKPITPTLQRARILTHNDTLAAESLGRTRNVQRHSIAPARSRIV